MIVLLAMKWIESKTESGEAICRLTQLTAERIAAKWLAVSSVDYLIAPLCPEDTDWEDQAYSGHSRKKFMKGVCEEDCIRDFLLWLEEDDTLFCWSTDTEKTLRKIISRYSSDVPSHPCLCLQEKITQLLCPNSSDGLSLYDSARQSGVEVEAEEHSSSSDVNLMRRMLAGLGPKAKDVLESALAEAGIPQRELDPCQEKAARLKRNEHLIQRRNYQYVYTPDSRVFHCNTCHYALGAEVLLGTPYYRRAAKRRRPCKRCKPDLSYLVQPPVPQATDDQPEKAESTDPAESKKKKPFLPRVLMGPLPAPDEPVLVYLLGPEKRTVLQDEIMGCCHYEGHPGKMTIDHIKRHHCLKKRCKHFEKYEGSSLWTKDTQQMAVKELRKSYRAYVRKAKSERKAKEASKADALEAVRAEFQRFMDALHYAVQIVRVESQCESNYRIFYVSDRPVLDHLYYPNFLSIVEVNHPHYQVTMQHIRDVEGHYVTIDEYRNIVR